jgi:hypothetical protein
MRHKYRVTSNGTGTDWNMKFRADFFYCSPHFKVYIYSRIPLIHMPIQQKSYTSAAAEQSPSVEVLQKGHHRYLYFDWCAFS